MFICLEHLAQLHTDVSCSGLFYSMMGFVPLEFFSPLLNKSRFVKFLLLLYFYFIFLYCRLITNFLDSKMSFSFTPTNFTIVYLFSALLDISFRLGVFWNNIYTTAYFFFFFSLFYLSFAVFQYL